MRIAATTFLVVLSCLLGGLTTAGIIWSQQHAVFQAQTDVEHSRVSAHDLTQLKIIGAQWLTTIDLFFAGQSYLSKGIVRQSGQMGEVLSSLDTEWAARGLDENTSSLRNSVQVVAQIIEAAALHGEGEPQLWEQALSRSDELTYTIVDEIETLSAAATEAEAQTVASLQAARARLKMASIISLLAYLALITVTWLWANRAIVRPLEWLSRQARQSVDENGNADKFRLARGPTEICSLASSLDTYSDRLSQARVRAERRLDKLQKTRAQLVQSEKMASIGMLAAGIAHEINNPMGFIGSNIKSLGQYATDLMAFIRAQEAVIDSEGDNQAAKTTMETLREDLDMEFLQEDLVTLLEETGEGCTRVKRIVSDLMEFSRVDTEGGKQENLAALVNRTLKLAGKELGTHVKLESDLDETVECHCEGGKIGQVVLNLVMNAVQALDGNGLVTVRCGQSDGMGWLEVQDNGCGIAQDKIAQIFDPFYTSKPVGEGTGLGLHITQSIVEKHDGEISVSSEEGVGTTFRVRLPLERPQAEARMQDVA